MDLKARAKKLKNDIPAVFIALKHPKTPWLAKVVAGLTIIYALSPIDFIPDFIPVIGYLDDLILLPLLVSIVVRLIPEDILRECRKQAEGLWQDGKPEKWFYAIPILLVWVLLIILLVNIFI